MIHWPVPTLPDDDPLNESGRKRYSDYRLDPAINALFDTLHFWQSIPVRQRATPPRIGLFGGLGQGKSTVVRCVLEKLEANRSLWQRIKALVWGSRIARFDVSFFKADDLEWRFLTAILWQRILHNLIPSFILSAAVLLAVVSLNFISFKWCWHNCITDWGQCARWLIGVWVSLFVLLPKIIQIITDRLRPLVTIFGKIKPYSPANGLYLSGRDLLTQKIARFMSALPDVVVVDDLDRACVEQQRGFLRAISRFSYELGFAVVICLDESELLAASPNPEPPEELLRKTINAELRIPDRTREDVVLLVMSCIREFVWDNPNLPLKPALQSVQVVADLTRVLLLSQESSAVSPRKVRRLLVRVVLHAMQLKLTAVDDLTALMRLDGLLQLSPALRRQMDGLRNVLEANRPSEFQNLLEKANVPRRQHNQLEQFFKCTRMMQPSMHDGWFRLLGGLDMTETGSSTSPSPWSAPWQISPRSHTFFRLYIEAIELDAIGYEHDLFLHKETIPAANTNRYKFNLPGGADVYFSLEDLPAGFNGVERNDYIGQCWVLWVCTFTSAPSLQKTALYERAFRWIGDNTDNTALRDLFWRECMADTSIWSGEDESSHRIHCKWWNRAHSEDSLPKIERFINHLFRPDSFADAWSILAQPGEARDGRKILHWWRGITPEVDIKRLQSTRDIELLSKIWPAPKLENQGPSGWSTVLKQHFQSVNALNAIKGQVQITPSPLLYTWQRIQVFLDVNQCLDLLFCLAYDEKATKGKRWSTRAVEPWIEVLDEERINELKSLLLLPITNHGGLQQPERLLTLLLLSGLRGWSPKDATLLVENLPCEEWQEIQVLLADRGILPDWIQEEAHKKEGGTTYETEAPLCHS